MEDVKAQISDPSMITYISVQGFRGLMNLIITLLGAGNK